jgi:DNA-binding NarL/FixJ family response regulator
VKEPIIRVLIVDDYERWRRFVVTTLEKHTELQIVGESADGLDAVLQCQALQPDLVLLDIGLPALNGIDAARRIRKVAPRTRILFVSENCSPEITEEALRTGAGGYLAKSDVASELWPAVRDVIQGRRFVSARLAGRSSSDTGQLKKISSRDMRQNPGLASSHKVLFYSDEESLLDTLTRFMGAALEAGNSGIVLATESHLESLRRGLEAQGFKMDSIAQGRYIALDAAEAITRVMLDGMPDPVQFLSVFDDLIAIATRAAPREHARVAIFGECVRLLLEQGNFKAVIHFEKLGNQLTAKYDVDILCAYSLASFQHAKEHYALERICEEHSAVCSL